MCQPFVSQFHVVCSTWAERMRWSSSKRSDVTETVCEYTQGCSAKCNFTLISYFFIDRNNHLSSSFWPNIVDLRISASCFFKVLHLHLADAFVMIKIQLDFLAIHACFQDQPVLSGCEQNAECTPKANCKIIFKIGSWHQCLLFWAAWQWDLMHKLTPNYPGSLCRRQRCLADAALQCIVVTGMQPFALVDKPRSKPCVLLLFCLLMCKEATNMQVGTF